MSELMHTYQDVLACDFSYYRPGFAILRYYNDKRKVKI